MSRSGPTLMAAFKAIVLVLRSTQEIHLHNYEADMFTSHILIIIVHVGIRGVSEYSITMNYNGGQGQL